MTKRNLLCIFLFAALLELLANNKKVTASEFYTSTSIMNHNNHILRTSSSRPIIRVVFSDIDGTLVHYPSSTSEETDKKEENTKDLRLPASSTGLRGIISETTIQLCQQLRQRNVKFVLVSGMRTTTLFQRLPYLPFADAYCSENGGRIFYPNLLNNDANSMAIQEKGYYDSNGSYVFTPATVTTSMHMEEIPIERRCYRLQEDLMWRKQQNIQELWEFASFLRNQNWVLDDKGYETCFRIHQKDNPQQDIAKILDLLPEALIATTNLGCLDVYPKSSGKKHVCQYLVKHKFAGGTLADNCMFLCDDDNDIELASSCRFAFLPAISSNSMKQYQQTHFDKIIAANSISTETKLGTTKATETILQFILEHFFSDPSVNNNVN